MRIRGEIRQQQAASSLRIVKRYSLLVFLVGALFGHGTVGKNEAKDSSELTLPPDQILQAPTCNPDLSESSAERTCTQQTAELCPVDVVLTEQQQGCRCGKEVLEAKHFRTLSYIQSHAHIVLMCKNPGKIVMTVPLKVK
jgi:hypothetical protein